MGVNMRGVAFLWDGIKGDLVIGGSEVYIL